MSSKLPIFIILLFCKNLLFAQSPSEFNMIYTYNGSKVKGKICAIDSIYSKKDTNVIYKVQIQGGAILDFNAKDISAIEKITDLDTSHWHNVAQTIPNNLPKKHQFYVELGFGIHTNYSKGQKGEWYIVPRGSVGLWLNPRMKLGIGTAIEQLSSNMYRVSNYIHPIYAEFEYNFIKKSFTPFVGVDLGYGIIGKSKGLGFQQYIIFEKKNANLLTSVDIGLRLPSKQRLHFKTGLRASLYFLDIAFNPTTYTNYTQFLGVVPGSIDKYTNVFIFSVFLNTQF